MAGYPFSEIRDRLDDWRLFNNMVESPYYRDAVYERFSTGEYEQRYNSAMDRVSGWYKRRVQWIILGLGLGIAIVVNAEHYNY
jgi:hypothetical protein